MSFTIFKFNNHISHILQTLGYRNPTPIQQQGIPPILEGKDVLGLAQTGTGKTAAFSLPILENLGKSSTSRRNIKALILAPTRELADQTASYIGEFTSGLGLNHGVIYGGVSREAQVRQIRKGVDIVVACPGRLIDLINTRDIELSKTEILVLDEADQMFDQGFLPDIRKIIAKLPKQRQNLVFSATMPGEVRKLIENVLKDPVKVSIQHKKPNKNIHHTFYQTEGQGKNRLLGSILKEQETTQAIIFTRTKYKARNLATQLTRKGFQATSLQGNLSQNRRQEALDGFKNGSYNVLVATDIAARGIDIAGISHVINYDMPGTTEAYTHRTGRTGRANRTGQAITFVTPEDNKMFNSLERILKEKLTCLEAVGETTAGETTHRKPEGQATQSPAKKGKAPRKRTRSKGPRRTRAAAIDFGI